MDLRLLLPGLYRQNEIRPQPAPTVKAGPERKRTARLCRSFLHGAAAFFQDPGLCVAPFPNGSRRQKYFFYSSAASCCIIKGIQAYALQHLYILRRAYMPKIFSDEEKQFHKNFLLDNGLRVIMENGYKHVTVDQLVQMIGASKGYFYLLFPSKEDFFLDALAWQMEKKLQAAGRGCKKRVFLRPDRRTIQRDLQKPHALCQP